jgi:hypothetical protein
VNKELGNLQESLQAFEKLHTIIPTSPVRCCVGTCHALLRVAAVLLLLRRLQLLCCPLYFLPVGTHSAHIHPALCPARHLVCLHVVVQEVIYQIGNLHDLMQHYRPAAKYFQYLITKVPSDPGALARLGQIFAKDDDETQAFHYHHEVSRGDVDVTVARPT